jgi:hypothetical protein
MSLEMLSLSSKYVASTAVAERTSLLGDGQAMLAMPAGTAFAVYYVLNAIALLLFSWFMLESRVFSTLHPLLGFATVGLMPMLSTPPVMCILFERPSQISWFVWLIAFGHRMFRLANGEQFGPDSTDELAEEPER